MTTNTLHRKSFMTSAGRILLAWIFVLSQCAWTQDSAPGVNTHSKANTLASTKAAPAATNAQGEEEASAPLAAEANSKGAPHEGIKVHGHWTIEVRDPKGNLINRREFENSLLTSGQFEVAALLGRTFSAGTWGIQFIGNGALCRASAGTPVTGTCSITEQNSQPSVDSHSLTVLGPASVGASPVVVLTGSVIVPNAGQITNVATILVICAPTNPASTPCFDGFDGFFTGTPLSPPQSVQAGQIVQLKVVLSFS